MGLDTVEILMKVEKRFGIAVPDQVASNCITVADLQNVIVDLLVNQGRVRSRELEAEVYRDLVIIIVDQMGMHASDVRHDSRWIGDITDYG
jgi:hypothetical protein